MKYSFLIVSLILLSGIVSALPVNHTLIIESETGETYIQWGWVNVNKSEVIPPLDVYIDDQPTAITTNYTQNTYLASKLADGSRHNIALYNTTDRLQNGQKTMLGKATTTTQKPAYQLYFLIALGVILILAALMLSDIVPLLLISVFNIIVCLFGASIGFNSGAISFLFYSICVIAAIILLVKGIPKLQDTIAWM
jgi:hypothetical protein